jgi:hypothetical protein
MFRSLFYATAVATFLALSTTAAMGQEADREKAFTNYDSNRGTVVVQVKDGKVTGIMHLDVVPKSDEEAQLIIKGGTFAPVDQAKVVTKDNPITESDKTAGISGYRVSGGGYGYGVGPRGNGYAYGYGYRGGGYYGGAYYGGYYGGYYPSYPQYYYGYGFYNPVYSYYYPYTDASYYYYNNLGWNTSWYPAYYYGGYNAYRAYGYYHRW